MPTSCQRAQALHRWAWWSLFWAGWLLCMANVQVTFLGIGFSTGFSGCCMRMRKDQAAELMQCAGYVGVALQQCGARGHLRQCSYCWRWRRVPTLHLRHCIAPGLSGEEEDRCSLDQCRKVAAGTQQPRWYAKKCHWLCRVPRRSQHPPGDGSSPLFLSWQRQKYEACQSAVGVWRHHLPEAHRVGATCTCWHDDKSLR